MENNLIFQTFYFWHFQNYNEREINKEILCLRKWERGKENVYFNNKEGLYLKNFFDFSTKVQPTISSNSELLFFVIHFGLIET